MWQNELQARQSSAHKQVKVIQGDCADAHPRLVRPWFRLRQLGDVQILDRSMFGKDRSLHDAPLSSPV